MGLLGNVRSVVMNYADLEFTLLNNATGTTVIHANTTGSRFALMGIQGATNTTGATIQVQEPGGSTNLTGAVPTVVNTGFEGFMVTGFPYAISGDSKGMQFVVSGSASFDGVLQFMEIPNA